MTMLFHRKPDSIEQLLQRTRALYEEVRHAAVQARQAAEKSKEAAGQQRQTAISFATEDDDA